MKKILEEEGLDNSRGRSGSLPHSGKRGRANSEKAPLLCARRERKWTTDESGLPCNHATNPRLRTITRAVTVEPVVILFYVSFNASIPIMQQYVYGRYAEMYGALDTNTTCSAEPDHSSLSFLAQQAAQAASARFMVAAALTCVLPALVTTLLLGPYSDQAGRRVAMLPALSGEVMRMVVNCFVIYFDLPLWIMLIAVFIDGILGSAGGVLMACFAYLSDITTRKQRTFRILLLEVCMGLGVVASQIGVGHMIVSLGYFWPMLTIAILNLVNFLYVVFFLPESMDRDPEAKLFSWSHMKKPFNMYIINDWKERRWKLQMCLIAFAVFTIVDLGSSEVITLFLLNSPLCFTPILIGYFNGIFYMMKNIGCVVIIKIFYRCTGDIGLALIGLLSGIAFELTLSQANNLLITFMAPVAGLGMLLVLPMIRSMASKLVEPEEQGALFATQGWMQLLAACLGSFFFNVLYSNTLFLIHGFVFMVAAGMLVIALVVGIAIAVIHRRDEQQHEEFEYRRALMDEFLDGKLTIKTGSFIGIG